MKWWALDILCSKMYSILDDRGEVLYPAFDGEGMRIQFTLQVKLPLSVFKFPYLTM